MFIYSTRKKKTHTYSSRARLLINLIFISMKVLKSQIDLTRLSLFVILSLMFPPKQIIGWEYQIYWQRQVFEFFKVAAFSSSSSDHFFVTWQADANRCERKVAISLLYTKHSWLKYYLYLIEHPNKYPFRWISNLFRIVNVNCSQW